MKRKDGFSLAGRYDQTDEETSPGPAAYNPRDSKRGGFSLAGRPTENLEDVGPGPAQYYPGIEDSTKRKLPAWSFGGKHRSENMDDLPGPGELI